MLAVAGGDDLVEKVRSLLIEREIAILMAMARELVTEKGIGESADAVWKRLQKQQAEVFGIRPAETFPAETELEPPAGDLPDVIISPPTSLPEVVTQLLMFGISRDEDS